MLLKNFFFVRLCRDTRFQTNNDNNSVTIVIFVKICRSGGQRIVYFKAWHMYVKLLSLKPHLICFMLHASLSHLAFFKISFSFHTHTQKVTKLRRLKK